MISNTEKLKIDNTHNIGKLESVNKFIDESKTKKHYISKLEEIKYFFDERIYNYMINQVRYGNLKPKYESETWIDYLNRITPENVESEI